MDSVGHSELTDKIISLYTKERLSVAKIATRLSLTWGAAYWALCKNKIPRRSRTVTARLYTLDEHACDVITEEAAYWIGFLMADGHITKQRFPQITLGLASKDRGHLEKYRRFFKSSNPISERHKGRSVYIQFASRYLVDKLAVFGIVPQKSLIAKIRYLEHSRDFWRGVVDGDGHLGFNRQKIPVLQLCGSKYLIKQFRHFILDRLPSYQIKVREHGPHIYAVWLGGRFATAIVKRLYENCCVSLDRKQEIANIIMRYKWKSKNYPSVDI